MMRSRYCRVPKLYARLDLDVLFFIPVPWIAQVWFPLLVSLLTMLVIGLCRGKQSRSLGGWAGRFGVLHNRNSLVSV